PDRTPPSGARPARREMSPRRVTKHLAPDLVRHLVARAAEVLLRRVREEVAHARRVEARVLLDLRAEARLLVLLLEERAPELVEALVDAPLDRRQLAVHEAQPPAHAVDRALDARPLGLRLGHVQAVGLVVVVLDLARQLLEARLVEAQLV